MFFKLCHEYIDFFQKNWKSITIVLILILILLCIFGIVASYYLLKWLKINIKENYFFCKEYTKESKRVLDKYGDFKIKSIYICRDSVLKTLIIVLNLITFNGLKNFLKKEGKGILTPYHTYIIVELELNNGMYKKILIEKEACVRLKSNFNIKETDEVKKIKFKEKKNTIKKILEKIRNKMGDEKYFNWQVKNNNCQEFSKQFLLAINKYNKKNDRFIFQKKLQKFKISNFHFHLINIFRIFYILTDELLERIYNSLLKS